MTTPRVSVIAIALSEAEFEPLRVKLSRQTFQDFEFIGQAGGTIPQAWNRALDRARGDILVFTETDATPVDERWLEQLVASIPDDRTLVKGLEIGELPWDLSNLAACRSVFQDARFDESFLWGEDTELFCRLRQRGYHFLHVDTAPVIHLHRRGSQRALRRAFRYGLYHARLRVTYGRHGIGISSLRVVCLQLVQLALNLAGFISGYVVYGLGRALKRRGAKDLGVDRQ